MRFVKLALISIVGLFVVIFLLSLLLPSRAIVSRAITINRPYDSVLAKLQDMREWEKWNLLLCDSSLSNKKFESNSFSATEMSVEITGQDEAGIKTLWKRKGQDPVASGLGVTAASSQTIVQWYFDINVGWYPWEKFGSIIFDKQLGPPMEKSLDELKKLCENN